MAYACSFDARTGVKRAVPFDGEICTKLGTYKSGCCQQEVVVAQGARFPRCPNHKDRPTEWKLLLEPKEFKKPKQRNP